jgi:hypothetical protein
MHNSIHTFRQTLHQAKRRKTVRAVEFMWVTGPRRRSNQIILNESRYIFGQSNMIVDARTSRYLDQGRIPTYDAMREIIHHPRIKSHHKLLKSSPSSKPICRYSTHHTSPFASGKCLACFACKYGSLLVTYIRF